MGPDDDSETGRLAACCGAQDPIVRLWSSTIAGLGPVFRRIASGTGGMVSVPRALILPRRVSAIRPTSVGSPGPPFPWLGDTLCGSFSRDLSKPAQFRPSRLPRAPLLGQPSTATTCAWRKGHRRRNQVEAMRSALILSIALGLAQTVPSAAHTCTAAHTTIHQWSVRIAKATALAPPVAASPSP